MVITKNLWNVGGILCLRKVPQVDEKLYSIFHGFLAACIFSTGSNRKK